jgi:hypothetical protein
MHLSNAFRKLDVSSRTQFVAALAAGEPAPVVESCGFSFGGEPPTRPTCAAGSATASNRNANRRKSSWPA